MLLTFLENIRNIPEEEPFSCEHNSEIEPFSERWESMDSLNNRFQQYKLKYHILLEKNRKCHKSWKLLAVDSLDGKPTANAIFSR